jgi:CheY-like chemotaxis protein
MTNPENQYKSKVLIAEDEDISYIFLSNILKRASFDVLRAKNGQEAVDLCKEQEEINLVLMDINMPVMDGLEATRIIKTFRSELPVIAVTAYTLNNTEHMAKAAGCVDYLSKPVQKETLISSITKHLGY